MGVLDWLFIILVGYCFLWGLNQGKKTFQWHRRQRRDAWKHEPPKRIPKAGTVFFMDKTIDDDHPQPIAVAAQMQAGYRLLYSYAAPDITREMRAVKQVLQPYKVRGGYHYDATRMIIDKLREGDLA